MATDVVMKGGRLKGLWTIRLLRSFEFREVPQYSRTFPILEKAKCQEVTDLAAELFR